jgi:hypothetical protein
MHRWLPLASLLDDRLVLRPSSYRPSKSDESRASITSLIIRTSWSSGTNSSNEGGSRKFRYCLYSLNIFIPWPPTKRTSCGRLYLTLTLCCDCRGLFGQPGIVCCYRM